MFTINAVLIKSGAFGQVCYWSEDRQTDKQADVNESPQVNDELKQYLLS